MNNIDIEAIVKQVIAGLANGDAPKASKAAGPIPATSNVAMLTALEHYDIKQFPIPELGDDDILVKVE